MVQMGPYVWAADFPTASDFFGPVLTCQSFCGDPANTLSVAEYCNPPEQGFHVPHVRQGRGPGALSTPGTTVPARPRLYHAAAAGRLTTAGPCHPGTTTRPGMLFSQGISKGSLAFAPPAIPLTCNPRTERGPLGYTPGFIPGRAGPGRACQRGDRPQAPARDHAIAISDLPHRTHSPRAVSRRNTARKYSNVPAQPPAPTTGSTRS